MRCDESEGRVGYGLKQPGVATSPKDEWATQTDVRFAHPRFDEPKAIANVLKQPSDATSQKGE